ncbi:uncharacterized protein LOC114741682 [Neltuma alba]|uniref:uncharacterized protein LOC114741682 n=1 Tax=Neltuma alba TaxID=207710 RepID=UPI0010A577C5|nr:uncharacterized protein LOC114741682 [Prosopis alba]
MSPHWLVYGKACHIPVKLEQKTYWVVKMCNMDLEESGLERKLQLQELEEMRLDAYETRFVLKPRKFKTRWDGPYRVTKVHDFGMVELLDEAGGSKFKVNGNLLKLYHDSTKPP